MLEEPSPWLPHLVHSPVNDTLHRREGLKLAVSRRPGDEIHPWLLNGDLRPLPDPELRANPPAKIHMADIDLRLQRVQASQNRTVEAANRFRSSRSVSPQSGRSLANDCRYG